MQLAHNQPEYTVSEISGAIKKTVEGEFSHVRVRGEISGCKFHTSGHVYMTLKDDKANIDAVIWKAKVGGLKIRPQDGLEIIATGKITTYSGNSKYQMNIDSIEVAGEGALMALLEKRKKELAAKGLFDEARKKPIPHFPKVIGVVTSPTGAVIRDILHRIAERFPLNVIVWPVKVQGEGAEHEIAAAIKGFNKHSVKPDIIIVARGGGSLEDLWCFNAEEVVYAVAESEIPIISAVGHETDTTLIDYAADLRAPTPTAAAELATEYIISDLRFTLSDFKNRSDKAVLRLIQETQNHINGLIRGLPRLSDLVGNYAQRLDDWTERLKNALPNLISKFQQKLDKLKLSPAILVKDLQKFEEKTSSLAERLSLSATQIVKQNDEKLKNQIQLLESYNYKNVLKRGFTITKTSDGKLIRSAKAAEPNMVIEFADGEVKVNKQGV